MIPKPMPPGYQATKPFIDEEDPQSRLPPGSIAVMPSPSWWLLHRETIRAILASAKKGGRT